MRRSGVNDFVGIGRAFLRFNRRQQQGLIDEHEQAEEQKQKGELSNCGLADAVKYTAQNLFQDSKNVTDYSSLRESQCQQDDQQIAGHHDQQQALVLEQERCEVSRFAFRQQKLSNHVAVRNSRLE